MKVCSVCRRCFEDSILSCSEENHEPLIESRVGNCGIIPNYRLEFLLDSSSAAGETFRALHEVSKNTFLIRIVAPELFDEVSRREFLSETQTISALNHKNVARVYESGVLADGSLYVVSEFFTAQTLRECLANVGAPSEVTALTISRQAADALEAIHALRVLHRSVKPENIILTTDAESRFLVKLQNIDFGGIRQKQINLNSEQNSADLRYFAPEQCAAETVDGQADVYGLGVVLYETLAGRVPFDAPDADALRRKIINETPPEIKIKNFDIRMLLTHTLSDSLQKLTRLRLKSANALARQLRHIEQLATHLPTPPPAVPHPPAMNKAAIVFTPAPKTETIVESAVLAEKTVEIPAVETLVESVVENQTIVENPSIAEEVFSNESQVLSEELPSVEQQTIVEDTDENQFVTKDLTPVESQPVEIKSVEKIEPPVFVDYSTTKLPPIESIVEKTSPAPNLKAENAAIHKSVEPILIDWEQPDDVPTITQALGKRKKEAADAAFAAPTVFTTNAAIDLGEIDTTAKAVETRSDSRPVLSYHSSGKSWNLPEKRKMLTGAGILALIVLAVGGTLWTRQIQSARSAGQTTAQSSPAAKTLPKPAEPEKVSPNNQPQPAKINNTVSDAENTDAPALPDFEPREADEKTSAPVSKKRASREISVRRETAPNKTFSSENSTVRKPETVIKDKQGNIKSVSPTPRKIEVFTRPRIVKNPKN